MLYEFNFFKESANTNENNVFGVDDLVSASSNIQINDESENNNVYRTISLLILT